MDIVRKKLEQDVKMLKVVVKEREQWNQDEYKRLAQAEKVLAAYLNK